MPYKRIVKARFYTHIHTEVQGFPPYPLLIFSPFYTVTIYIKPPSDIHPNCPNLPFLHLSLIYDQLVAPGAAQFSAEKRHFELWFLDNVFSVCWWYYIWFTHWYHDWEQRCQSVLVCVFCVCMCVHLFVYVRMCVSIYSGLSLSFFLSLSLFLSPILPISLSLSLWK